MREYAFDVKMFAVVRINALSRKVAEKILNTALDCADLNVSAKSGFDTSTITESSVYIDDVGYPYLFEVDGIDVDNDESEADTDVSELDDFNESG
jgi:hypothetical protein